MRLILAFIILSSSSVHAEPMWQQANHWVCSLERHMRAPSGATVVEMDPEERFYRIDFVNEIVTSAFVDGEAPTIQRDYFETQGVNYNVLINDWGYGQYPSIIMEQDGSFWNVAGSGTLEPGEDVWIAVYQCRAEAPKS